MEKILLYTQTLNPDIITSVIDEIEEHEVESVCSRLELAESIVEKKNVFCVLIQLDGLDHECRLFLDSLKEIFPLLNVAVITQVRNAHLPEGYCRIDIKVEEIDIRQELGQFISSIAVTNRRNNHRFDWPLQGFLSVDQETWQQYHIRSLSSSGAFLECKSFFPEPGSKTTLRIVFGNFKMHTKCEILDPRQASSNLPPGFGVKFSGLSESSRMVIDKIVHDALIHILLEPESEPEMPSLSDDDLLTEDFELM